MLYDQLSGPRALTFTPCNGKYFDKSPTKKSIEICSIQFKILAVIN